MPRLFVIAGCNGAGKTTASYTMMPEMLEINELVNADEIAKGLSPFNPESVAIQAGKIMLMRVRELIAAGADFAFETTLATKSYYTLIKDAQERGYFVTLLYMWLPSPEQAIKRVAQRVAEGGHNIPEAVIRRRYRASIKNLFNIYAPVCDYWMIYDSSDINYGKKIAVGSRDETKTIYDSFVYSKLENYE
ncbi:MAG: zeta toxin family protein [Rikenellaceae bacterium]|nr:zeta toxin family protein [Rikenellaceae bacterium]